MGYMLLRGFGGSIADRFPTACLLECVTVVGMAASADIG
ncbi:Hypothetical protein CpOVI2C_00087 [Corynebacterium pseudotuberculosis]|nr:Hypothetical protein CpPa08_0084 [Corynebacterium pseudotuberculosis]AUY06113.1 Hypothetical protein CpOVI2C_00087 [Corynebacterium pseudotuberculosis]AZN18981.1 hypothetical protein CpCap1W_0092 [Corynebacterium pseudotuberculosis]QBB90117.1 hypothetical protein CpCR07_0094 [Corynebacterium pseudotuberculosis]QBB92228.1 hypothetical protein CpCAPNAT1_00092 [Corynebacterium pseudotuberculosis]